MYRHHLFTYLQRGDYTTVQKGMVTASVWMDRKAVTVMSTSTQPQASATVQRRQRDGSRIPVTCPESMLQYNAYMGGVDRGDQVRGYYSCRTKSRKFYKYIFYFLLDVAITNAFILHKECNPNHRMKIKDFRLKLATQLIGEYCSRRRPGRKSSAIVPLPIRHFPIKLQSDSQPTKKQRGRCAQCSKSHNRTDTTWFCRECNVWLCHNGDPSSDCFFLWHKRLVGAEQ